ncbi:MAG: general secretion pathway protein GspB [Desulfosarcina sp.]|nr:general secretion pathway protein GspB [Desulfosarcina sp.]
MSSILDALKKAEQEATVDPSAGTPWPSPLSAQSPHRKRSRRWWVPLGIAVGLCAAGVVLWQVRQANKTRPAESMSALPSPSLPKPNPSVVTPAAEAPETRLTVDESPQTPPGETLKDDAPRQSTEDVPASEVRGSDAMAVVAPDQPEKQPLRAAAPTAASSVQPTPLQLAQPLRQTAVPTSIPVAAPTEEPAPRPAETAAPNQPAAARETEKPYRSDPRIDLQALVWAPESTARFVVINNRLIKEGGSVDNIVVVRINPDDVLLAEGSDRWHEAFKIR